MEKGWKEIQIDEWVHTCIHGFRLGWGFLHEFFNGTREMHTYLRWFLRFESWGHGDVKSSSVVSCLKCCSCSALIMQYSIVSLNFIKIEKFLDL